MSNKAETRAELERELTALAARFLGNSDPAEHEKMAAEFEALDAAYDNGVRDCKAMVTSVLVQTTSMLESMQSAVPGIRTTIGALRSFVALLEDPEFATRRLSTFDNMKQRIAAQEQGEEP